ncbi:hypothetical protein HYPSUDRAFT_207610 [Hypholoma sublateritium FD-334 SS-4]|uniref:Uncharacterized protein n=1 Tax=Hypholoma sublateritium (strain FD-334 SS-4) TaxID=945553 RepID=A0A0D2P5R4_HYPSF|nr:hypothetical protein HYPSUDRAFT_207610 [Hypholoma sublateritium FD-334 SS-4]
MVARHPTRWRVAWAWRRVAAGARGKAQRGCGGGRVCFVRRAIGTGPRGGHARHTRRGGQEAGAAPARGLDGARASRRDPGGRGYFGRVRSAARRGRGGGEAACDQHAGR